MSSEGPVWEMWRVGKPDSEGASGESWVEGGRDGSERESESESDAEPVDGQAPDNCRRPAADDAKRPALNCRFSCTRGAHT